MKEAQSPLFPANDGGCEIHHGNLSGSGKWGKIIKRSVYVCVCLCVSVCVRVRVCVCVRVVC